MTTMVMIAPPELNVQRPSRYCPEVLWGRRFFVTPDGCKHFPCTMPAPELKALLQRVVDVLRDESAGEAEKKRRARTIMIEGGEDSYHLEMPNEIKMGSALVGMWTEGDL